MKIERTKNASKNIVFGVFLRLQQTVLPFLMRTVMIHCMGVQYLGLNSLFTSILHILNLAELGVGNAMVFSMYQPIAEDDEDKICALMALYRKYYRIIGLVIGGVGLLLTPMIPYLIEGDVPSELNVYVLYLLNLGATVLSYWLFAYKNCLFQAHQRNDRLSMVSMVTGFLQCGVQMIVLLYIKNYYLYLLTALASQVLTNLGSAYMANRMYPQYSPRGRLTREETKKINGKIRDLFTGKVGAVVLNSADSVVISAFLGLSALAVYQNYYFIVTAIIGVIEIMLQSVMAGLGNSFVTETKQKNFQDLKKFTFIFMWLVGICVCCFLGLYQPFMKLWVGEELMLRYGAVICFAVYFFVYCMNRLLNAYKDAAGLWYEDRFRPLVTAAVNLTLNLLSVKFLGIYGVLLSTVVSIVAVGIPWLMHNMFTVFFQKSNMWEYLRQIFVFLVTIFLAGAATVCACIPIQGSWYIVLPVRLLVCVAVPNALFLLLMHRSKQFSPSIQMLDRLTQSKLDLERRLFHKKSHKQ